MLYFCCIAVSTYPSFSPSHLPSFCPPSFGLSHCHPLYPSRSFVYPSISPCPSLPPFLFDNGGLSAGICRHPFQAAGNGLSAGPDLAMDEPVRRCLNEWAFKLILRSSPIIIHFVTASFVFTDLPCLLSAPLHHPALSLPSKTKSL